MESNTRLFRWIVFGAVLLATASSPADPAAAARLEVVATTTDVAAVLRAVGGEDVEVVALARGYQDPHYVEAKPSYIVKMRRADALAYVGLELEVGWLPLLIEGARNDDLLLGRPGNIPMSVGIDLLEVPVGEVSRAEGDVHPLGNPHYTLDPRNLLVMAQTAATALARIDPERSEQYEARRANFSDTLGTAIQRWESQMEPWRGQRIVCYHKQWEYLARWLGLTILDYVETRAGIPPSPRHVRALEQRMVQERIPILLISNFFDPHPAQRIAELVGAELVILPAAVAGEEGLDDPVVFFDHLVNQLDAAFRRATVQ